MSHPVIRQLAAIYGGIFFILGVFWAIKQIFDVPTKIFTGFGLINLAIFLIIVSLSFLLGKDGIKRLIKSSFILAVVDGILAVALIVWWLFF